MTLLLSYVLLALGVSFFCSVLEAVLLSITPAYLARSLQENQPLGQRLQHLKKDIDRPLSAILSLNTIAHTIGAAGAGAQAAEVFGNNSIGVFSAVLTLLILVLSEIIPKTLGAVYWRQLTPLVSRTLPPLMALLWPLVALSKVITRLLSPGYKGPTMSRAEIAALAHMGSEAGLFKESESRILKNLFRLRTVEAQDIMTPRTVIFSLQQNQTVEEVMAENKEMPFTRIPIYDTNPEDIRGYIHKDDLLQNAARDQLQKSLKSMQRKITSVSQEMGLLDLFERLADDREHIALVEDPFGGIAGLVTFEDLIETLLGLEIVDEYDQVPDMQEWARKQRRQRTRTTGSIPAYTSPTPAPLSELPGKDKDAETASDATSSKATSSKTKEE